MNTSSVVRLASFVVIGSCAASAPAWGALPVPPGALIWAVAQSSSDDTIDPRTQCDRLLREAREALRSGNLETAESFLGRAEKLDVRYGVLHLGDTPKKLRRDVTKARARQAKPSEKFTAGNLEQQDSRPTTEATDPFARPTDSAPPEIQSLNDPKAQSRIFLQQGRQALAAGDMIRAAHWQHKAAESGTEFGPDEDSPAKLAAEIEQRGGRVIPLKPTAAEASVSPFDTPVGSPIPSLPDRQAGADPFATSQGPPLDGGASNAFVEQGARELAGGQPAPASESISARARVDAQVMQARQSLSVGDVRRTSELIAAAAKVPMVFGPHDDSPDRVAAALRKHQELTTQHQQQGDTPHWQRAWAVFLMEQSEGLIRWNQWDEAERLASDAARMPVTFGPLETKPDDVLARIAQARRGETPSASQAVHTQADAAPSGIQQAGFQNEGPNRFEFPEESSSSPLDATQPPVEPLPDAQPPTPEPVPAPLDTTPESTAPRNTTPSPEPVPTQAPASEALSPGAANAPSVDSTLIENTQAQQDVLAKTLAADITRAQRSAKQLQETNPREALQMLQEARGTIETSGVDAPTRQALAARVQSSINELERYLRDNAGRIGLEESNQAVLAEIERERRMRVEIDTKLGKMVDEHNRLMNEQRYGEAEVVAKKAKELAPNNATVIQLNEWSAFVRRHMNNLTIKADHEKGFLEQLESVDQAAVGIDDRIPYSFGDPLHWADLTKNRKALERMNRGRRSEKDREIEQKLKTPVPVRYKDTPLADVMQTLSKLAGVSIHLDPQGLAEEGISTDTPISLELSDEIALKSALNLILDPLSLSYVIKDEVLKITSASLRDGEVYTVTYPVADLVIPIPNFLPTQRMGLAAELHNAHESVGLGGAVGGFGSQGPLAVVASRDGSPTNAMLNPQLLAQMNSGAASGGAASSSAPTGFGPGGMGGGAQADFDSLIQLMTSTVEPESWDEAGGRGSVQPFATNLSLVVSQTQEVHEQIVDLLEQLRRLQDLQVTIEVRFITLNDNFFERIGVDFDFDIDDNTDRPFQVFGQPSGNDPADTTNGSQGVVARDLQDRDHGPSVFVGRSSPDLFSVDLDVPFRQGSFGLAVPQFGGFDPNAGAQLGFAILSDLEAFFFISAAQGDRRSNVLQAPKVTLFNGQVASISDTSQSPFVISVIPVVGDFAAAQQPVIVVLSEGTFLTVQAVVSSDRRFVRLTVVPFFSQIGEVNTFTFTGSTTTVDGASSTGPDSATTGRANNRTTTTEGTTVQLPTFSFVTVSTTVSVPDGGTVLLGGIKRLSEGRNEFGVPLLNKIPYVNRLFSNVGIGRETQSLMMMVTPRIIIQEEEEQLLGVQTTTP